MKKTFVISSPLELRNKGRSRGNGEVSIRTGQRVTGEELECTTLLLGQRQDSLQIAPPARLAVQAVLDVSHGKEPL